CAVVESVKAASDVYSPVSGEVVAVNSALSDKPETINEDAYGEGWIFVVRASDTTELDDLLDPDAYAELIEDEEKSVGACVRPVGTSRTGARAEPEAFRPGRQRSSTGTDPDHAGRR